MWLDGSVGEGVVGRKGSLRPFRTPNSHPNGFRTSTVCVGARGARDSARAGDRHRVPADSELGKPLGAADRLPRTSHVTTPPISIAPPVTVREIPAPLRARPRSARPVPFANVGSVAFACCAVVQTPAKQPTPPASARRRPVRVRWQAWLLCLP